MGVITVAGRVRVVQREYQTGRIVADTGWSANTVTNGYLAALTAWAVGTPNGIPGVPPATQTILGTGTGTPAVTDTALFAPDTATILACASRVVLPTPANTAQWVSVYTAPLGTYSECGLTTADGTLYAHKLATITISSDSQTTVTWQITASAG